MEGVEAVERSEGGVFSWGEIPLQQKLGSLAYRPVSVEEAFALPACNHEIDFQWTFHWSKLRKKQQSKGRRRFCEKSLSIRRSRDQIGISKKQDELCEDTSLIILPARVISDTLA